MDKLDIVLNKQTGSESTVRARNVNDILFDDVYLLESFAGKESLKISSINANCDCAGYYSKPDNDDLDPQKSPGASSSTN